MEHTKRLRWLMAIPALMLIASVMAEISNCHRAQMAIRQDLNDTIMALAQSENNIEAKQDSIRRLEEINYAMAQPLVMVADQTMPGTLLALALTTAIGMAYAVRTRRVEPLTVVALTDCSTRQGNPSALSDVHLTPMQRQLVDMLMSAPSHCVPKRDICATLWGNKDNAEESLYTLVRRTKKALADAGAEIVCNRGESYQLTWRG